MKSPARRSFLKAIGSGAVALPFAGVLSDSVAQEAGEELPLKFIGMYHPHGVSAEYWAMRDGETEDSFDIAYENCSLQPFDDPATYGKSFKDKILVVEGLDLQSAANGHDSCGTILTGSRIDTQPANTSLDQFLAIDEGLGADTRLASVALAVGQDGSESGTTLSYGPGGAPLPKIIDPVQAFDLLFAGFVVGDDPAAQAAAARGRARGNSVIDFVRGDINRMKPKLGAREQAKLDQHLTSLRELEKQFTEATVGASCVVPTAPDPTAFPKTKRYNGGEEYFIEITNTMIDILAQAMACDITRFATLFMNDLSYAGNPYGFGADNHGAIAHTYDASPVGANGNGQGGVPGTWVPLAQMNKYSYGHIARLMQKLDEFGALDSTLIYASSDMGNPSIHSTNNVPTLLAGGVNGKFRMGRRIRLAHDCTEEYYYCGPADPSYKAIPTNRLLVSIAQAFGANIDAFGTQPDGADAGTLDGLV
jgi:hypothetical protein